MRRTADIVIVGSGVVGASVAWHLTQSGARNVLILERESAQCMGSTGKATGGVRVQFGTEVNISMSLYSLDFFEGCGFDTGYEPRGYLLLATSDEQMNALRSAVQLQRALGYYDVAIFDTDTISERVPGLNCDDIIGGSFGGRDGFIDPLKVTAGFTSGALAAGGAIQFDIFVNGIRVKAGKVESVSTDRGEIDCGSVVLCAGAWSRELASTAGIHLPVKPLKRQIVWARAVNALPEDLPMVIEMGSGFHFRPAREFGAGPSSVDRRDLFMAYPEPNETSSFCTEFDPEFIDKVYGLARRRAPFLDGCETVLEKCRAGLYENTPDHHAILGRCDVEGLYLATGFSGHGVMHSPATGRALSEIILTGESRCLDVTPLSIERFSRGKLLKEQAYY